VDSRKHTLATGAKAQISRKVGGKYRAVAGKLEGKNLLVVAGKQIIQIWRATHGKKEDSSVLILNFTPVAGGAQIDLVTSGCPLTITKEYTKVGRNTTGAPGRNTCNRQNSFLSTPAYELHDLKLIPCIDPCFAPFRFRQNPPVVLDRHATRVQS
jgi:hypothetical protein